MNAHELSAAMSPSDAPLSAAVEAYAPVRRDPVPALPGSIADQRHRSALSAAIAAYIEARGCVLVPASEWESAKADTRRLDFLDRANARLNGHYGTEYGWKLIMNHNVNRLILGRDAIDLHDSEGGNKKLRSCRDALDERMREVAALRAAPAVEAG